MESAYDILKDPRVRASLERLKALGIKTYNVAVDEDTIAIILDVESIINYIRKTIDAKVTYPNKHFIYDKELLVFAVVLSRSAKKLARLNDTEVARALGLYMKLEGEGGER